MKVNFVVRRTKKKVDGCVPIEMTICVKGKRQYVSTGRSVLPSKFSPKTQTVKGDKELNEATGMLPPVRGLSMWLPARIRTRASTGVQ